MTTLLSSKKIPTLEGIKCITELGVRTSQDQSLPIWLLTVCELSVSQIRNGQVLEFTNIWIFFLKSCNFFCRKFLGKLNNSGPNFNGVLQISKVIQGIQESDRGCAQSAYAFKSLLSLFVSKPVKINFEEFKIILTNLSTMYPFLLLVMSSKTIEEYVILVNCILSALSTIKWVKAKGFSVSHSSRELRNAKE